MPQPPEVDVAIVGAGPAGLALGCALQRYVEGINVQIFDRVDSFKRQGAGLGLDINGLKALRAMGDGVLSKVREAVTSNAVLVLYGGWEGGREGGRERGMDGWREGARETKGRAGARGGRSQASCRGSQLQGEKACWEKSGSEKQREGQRGRPEGSTEVLCHKPANN